MKITRTAKTVCGRSFDIRGTTGTTGGGERGVGEGGIKLADEPCWRGGIKGNAEQLHVERVPMKYGRCQPARLPRKSCP